MTGRAIQGRVAGEVRYPMTDPWAKGFCSGYIWTWRILRMFGFKETV